MIEPESQEEGQGRFLRGMNQQKVKQMPTYEYRCNNCKHEFDTFQSIVAKRLRKCPKCSKLTLKRLISGGGAILFKGKGFYSTDYPSKSYTDGLKKENAIKDAKQDKTKDAKQDTTKDAKQDKPPHT